MLKKKSIVITVFLRTCMLCCWIVLFSCLDAFSAEDLQLKNALAKVDRKQNNSYNIKDFGATGNGRTVDTKAINDAIDAAAKAGGGTVYFPAGTYVSFSIRLKSNIALYFDQGSVLLAADSTANGKYDDAEPNEWGDKFQYQDYGHSHWHNSLIWGENLENISILGTGIINGAGLRRFASPR